MGVKGKRVHLIEQMSDCIISFQKGIVVTCDDFFITGFRCVLTVPSFYSFNRTWGPEFHAKNIDDFFCNFQLLSRKNDGLGIFSWSNLFNELRKLRSTCKNSETIIMYLALMSLNLFLAFSHNFSWSWSKGASRPDLGLGRGKDQQCKAPHQRDDSEESISGSWWQGRTCWWWRYRQTVQLHHWRRPKRIWLS